MSDDSCDELPLDSKPLSKIGKHIYFDEEHEDNAENTLIQQKIIERPVSSTIRMDGSDLISRCQNLIPLLSDTNANTTSKDQSDDKNNNEDEEFHLPDDNDDSSKSEKNAKESGEASSSADEEIVKKKRKKKKKKKKKKLKTDLTDIPVNNQDLSSQ
ncbi:hypothetical protein I4U23_012211 [Adineta vaga]|nr:hypothetical protein I4U23_012211 [Adineta vaga]